MSARKLVLHMAKRAGYSVATNDDGFVEATAAQGCAFRVVLPQRRILILQCLHEHSWARMQTLLERTKHVKGN